MSMMTLLGKLFRPSDPRAIMTPGINGQYPLSAGGGDPSGIPSVLQAPRTPGFNPNAQMIPPTAPLQTAGPASPTGLAPNLAGSGPMAPVITQSASRLPSPLSPEDGPDPTALVGRPLPVPQVNMQVAPRPSVVGPDLQSQMDQDYATARASIARMPRKQEYGSKLTTGLGMLGELGANMMASSPNRWVRAAGPTTNKVSSMVADAGYNKALQNWKEQQAIDQGLQNLSNAQAKTKTDLDKSEAQADVYRAQAELARARPGMASKQIDLTSEQAKIYGYSQDQIDEAEATGIPLKGDASVMRSRITEKREIDKTKLRTESLERVRNKKIESDERVAKAHDDAKKAMVELQEASRDWRNAMDNESRLKVQESRAATTRSVQAQRNANVDKMMNAKTSFERAKLAMYNKTMNYQQTATLAAEKMLLADPATPGKIIPLETWQQRADNGDEEALAVVKAYYGTLGRISKEVSQMHAAIENSTGAVYGQSSGPAQGSVAAPSPSPVETWTEKEKQDWQGVKEGQLVQGPGGKKYRKVNGQPVVQPN